MSARVGLIVTGKCEHKALGGSLQRVFPDATFSVLSREPLDSFTSADLREMPESRAPTSLRIFAQRIVAAVEDNDPPDLVVAIDDLELVNAPHSELVAQRVRDAVAAHLQNHTWTSNKTQRGVTQLVRERCSFHLLAPMVEAYFFAEPAALTRAGATRPAHVDLAIDLEDFVTDDPGYLGYPHMPHDKKKGKSWAIDGRDRHPKHYLRFLCAPTDPYTKQYRESKGGAAALSELAWPQVFKQAVHVQFARALFEDLAAGLGVPHPFPGTGHPATSDFKQARVLRNL